MNQEPWIPFHQLTPLRKLIQKFIFRYRSHHQAIKYELAVWMEEKPPLYIVMNALRAVVKGEAKQYPIGYVRKIISIEWKNYNERHYVATHKRLKQEEKKAAESVERGGTVAAAGAIISSIMAGMRKPE